MIRPIHPGLSPNVERKDFTLALSRIVQMWTYNKGNETKKLENWFEKKYHCFAFAFSSGRGCLYAILMALDIQKGDEILVTGFTCVAVVDAILAIGARPIYVDITKKFTLDVGDLRKKITKKTRAMLIQHTFGLSSIAEEIEKFANFHSLHIIEDVAHGIGIRDNGVLLGTKGIAALFSFGRDKAFSCVSGGMVITKNLRIAEKLKLFQSNQKDSSTLWVFQNLFHIVSMYSLVLPLYDVLSLGKGVLILSQKIGLLAKPIDSQELLHFSLYTQKLSPALAAIALSQLERLEKFNTKRKKNVLDYIASVKRYYPNMIVTNKPLLRYPLLAENPNMLKQFARDKRVYLGDWYSNGIDPKGTNKEKLFYTQGSCPQAEHIAKHIINLPTYPTLSTKDVQKVVTILTSYAQNSGNHK